MSSPSQLVIKRVPWIGLQQDGSHNYFFANDTLKIFSFDLIELDMSYMTMFLFLEYSRRK
jgi:hypothetical protein